MSNNAVFAQGTRRSTGGLILAVLVAVVATLMAAPLAQGQVTTGDIVGTVTDATGAVVANANVTATNIGTQVKRTTNTGASGDYTFNLLQPGQYLVAVEASGFKKTEITSVNLPVGARVRVDAKLELGAVQEKVEVRGDAVPALQTDSASVQSDIATKDISTIPLNGRNFINLVQLQPGVNAGNSRSIQSGGLPDDRRQSSVVQANGQSEFFNNQMVDGLDNNERQQAFIGVRPSIDSIAEMQVVTNNYSAQFGRAGGAVVNIITKSGTNQFHGSAFEYLRNDALDARDFFATKGVVAKPKLNLNQFGFSLGGPIRKDKTFFFGAMEWFRQIQGKTFLNTVPTLYEQQHPGDFSDLNGFMSGVVNPAALSPVALNYFKLYPQPNLPGQVAADGSGVITNNFVYGPRRTQFAKTMDIRIDHHFGDHDSIFGHYAYNPVSTVTPPQLPPAEAFGKTVYSQGAPNFAPGVFSNIDGTSQTTAQAIGIDYVHVFSPNLLLNLKAGYNRININSYPYNYGDNLSGQFGVQNSNLGTAASSGLATILFFAGPYASLGDGYFVPLTNINSVYQFNGMVTYTRGRHSLKIGGGLIDRQMWFNQENLSPQGGFTYFPGMGAFVNPMLNFLAGAPTLVQRANNLSNPEFLQKEPSLFVQDDWRVTDSLTLNLGLRWDVFTPMTEAHNYYSNFDPTTLKVVVAGQGTTSTLGVNTKYTNFAPRLGAAWSPLKNTVIRGGFGMSYFPVDYSGVQQNLNPPWTYTCFLCTFAPFPVLPEPTADLNNLTGGLNYRPPDFGPGRLYQWNVNVQHQIGLNVFSVGYVGSVGRGLIWARDLDRPLPPGAYNPQPSFVYATQLPNVNAISESTQLGHNNYNSLVSSYQRRFGHGFSANANYTWAHGLEIGGGPTANAGLLVNNPEYDYGNSYLDIRHRFVIMFSYEFPFAKQSKGITAVLAKGWQANFLSFWQTGRPATVGSSLSQGNGPTACGGNPCPNPGSAYINLPGVRGDRPDTIGDTHVADQTIYRWFNTSAFAPQTVGTPGNTRINSIYGPHDRRVDFSLFKTFTVTERVNLQFRAECFNVSNTPNFDQPNVTLGNPTFGTITSTNPQEMPRQFQFALRVQF